MTKLNQLYRFGFVLALAFTAPACNGFDRSKASDVVTTAGGAACKLIPIFDRSNNGAFVGAICAELVDLVAKAITAAPAMRTSPNAPCELVPIKKDERVVGYVCPSYVPIVTEATTSTVVQQR